ncbi:MAG: thymidylate synthase [Candidatus Thorarchaeota archaeon]
MSSVIYIEAEDVGSAWLEALKRVLEEGDDIPTEYDKKDDPPSKDSTALIRIKKPLSNPIRSRRGKEKKILKIKTNFGNTYEVYGCLADIFLIGSIQSGYIEEVLNGVNDHYLWESSHSFPYSYHDRIYNYSAFSLEDSVKDDYSINLVEKQKVKIHEKLKHAKLVIKSGEKEIWRLHNGIEIDLNKEISEQVGINNISLSLLNLPRINQIDFIVKKLKKNPNTRRAQAITWRPYIDPLSEDPPCLQRLFFRIKNEKLILQTCWRSRDLFKAWEANVNGMIRIQKSIADELKLKVGEYIDFSNSLHLYGKDIKEVNELLNNLKIQQKKAI